MNTYLTKIVTNPIYNQIRTEIWEIGWQNNSFGRKSIQKALRKVEESLKSFLVPGMLFEELDLDILLAIDGHDLPELVSTLDRIKDLKSPALLHVLTKKGKGMVSTNVDDEYYLDAVKFHAVKPNKKAEVKIETSQAVKNAPVFQDVLELLFARSPETEKTQFCITVQ